MAKAASRWQYVTTALIGVCVLVHGSEAQQPGSSLMSQWCHGEVCYHLYQFNETAGNSWVAANLQCEAHGLYFTAVWNETVQDALNATLPLNENVTGHAWLAGRRSDDRTPVWFNDKVYNGSVPSSAYACGYMYQLSISITHCLVRKTCICERNDEIACGFDTVPYGDKCVWINRGAMTWYDCRSKCGEDGGDLASLVGGIPQLMASLQAVTGIGRNGHFWVGLERRPWSWISGTGHSTSTRHPMEYYNFGIRSFAKCLVIDVASSRKWSSLQCFGKVPFFICDNDTETREKAGTIDTDGPTEGDPEFVLTTGALAGIAVGGLVILITIIVISVILWQRRQRETNSQDTTTIGVSIVGSSSNEYNADQAAQNEAYYEPLGEGASFSDHTGRIKCDHWN